MRLCFGIFARILNCCNQGFAQDKFVPRIAWVVDRRNSSLASKLDFDVNDPDGMEGNPPVVSRLLSCERPLELRDGHFPSVEIARERFRTKVMPFFDEDRIATAVLAILYVISRDETIGDKHKSSFKKYLGKNKEDLIQQNKFDALDFFVRVLLYTTCVDNEEGSLYVKEITNDFVETVVKNSWVELKWDATTQTVEVIPTEEKRLWDEVNTINRLQLSVAENQYDYVDTGWSGVDEKILFPSRYGRIEFLHHQTW
jgi:hypothetical protein